MKFEWNTKTATVLIVVGLVAAGIVSVLGTSGDSETSASGESSIAWHGFDEGMALAAKENKKVLVDVYTDWCVWCKKMDKEVYTDMKVVEILKANFIAVKLNPEVQQDVSFNNERVNGGRFAQAMGVSGYPSTLIFGGDGTPITKIDGFQQAQQFATLLTFIGEDHYKTKSFQQFRSEMN